MLYKKNFLICKYNTFFRIKQNKNLNLFYKKNTKIMDDFSYLCKKNTNPITIL